MTNFEKLLIAKLNKKGYIYKDDFYQIARNFIEPNIAFDILLAQGLPIFEYKNRIYLKTFFRSIKKEEFIILDLETNGNNPQNSQIIEIGAYKIKNFKIIDTFCSLIYADFIPEYITKLTGIDKTILRNAPKERIVLTKFKEFLADNTIIAHNANFDYNYLSKSMEKVGIGTISNRVLCSIKLAERTLKSSKYGLVGLSCELGFNIEQHHRALNDAFATVNIFNKSLEKLPKNIVSVEKLICFSKVAKRLV